MSRVGGWSSFLVALLFSSLSVFAAPLAKVGEQAIDEDDLAWRIRAVTKGKMQLKPSANDGDGKSEASQKEKGNGPTQASPQLRSAQLRFLIDQSLIGQYLDRTKHGASDQDVSQLITQLSQDLKRRNETFPKYLKQAGLTEKQFRKITKWELGWNRYLERQLTDENMKRFYDSRPREYDGTTIHVAHIFFKAPANASPEVVETASKKASAVRQEMEEGKKSFEELAATHSEAPTAKEGGDIGWIAREEPMSEEFSRAAYAIKVGEVSKPVRSPVGFHIIRVLEEKRGENPWQDSRRRLADDISRYLFRKICKEERERLKVELSPDADLRDDDGYTSDAEMVMPASPRSK